MLAYLETKDDALCCGCRSCELSCPKNAISLKPNDEGFLYPVLDETLCVNCGICEKVCPIMVRPSDEGIKSVYAVQHKEDDILKKSSSGGVFRLLADEIISQGGYVAGCVWNEKFNPVLRITNNTDELFEMMGSKYLSSDTNTVYSEVKDLLTQGKKVLFTGTPCQCAGLLTYLKKPYENLLTADFICHGVPSQMAFDSYLNTLLKKHRITIDELTSYKFRDKEKRGWGKCTSYTYKKGGSEIKKYSVAHINQFMFGFQKSYFTRYSCYDCAFRGEKRFTDFTFCDYWGVEKYHSQLDITKGVSALAINTQAGETFYKSVAYNAVGLESKSEWVSVLNPSLTKKEKNDIPHLRKTILKKLNSEGWEKVAKQHLNCKGRTLKIIYYSLPRNMVEKVRTSLVKIIKR